MFVLVLIHKGDKRTTLKIPTPILDNLCVPAFRSQYLLYLASVRMGVTGHLSHSTGGEPLSQDKILEEDTYYFVPRGQPHPLDPNRTGGWEHPMRIFNDNARDGGEKCIFTAARYDVTAALFAGHPQGDWYIEHPTSQGGLRDAERTLLVDKPRNACLLEPGLHNHLYHKTCVIIRTPTPNGLLPCDAIPHAANPPLPNHKFPLPERLTLQWLDDDVYQNFRATHRAVNAPITRNMDASFPAGQIDFPDPIILQNTYILTIWEHFGENEELLNEYVTPGLSEE